MSTDLYDYETAIKEALSQAFDLYAEGDESPFTLEDLIPDFVQEMKTYQRKYSVERFVEEMKKHEDKFKIYYAGASPAYQCLFSK